MSLRTEMRDALHDVVPATPPRGLSERVLRTAISEKARRRSAELWPFRLHAPLSLVAALALVAVMSGVLVGGRLIWNDLHNSSAASSSLTQLESIPLTLPLVTSGEACPENSGVNSLGYDYGSGPIYVNGQLIPELSTAEGGLYDLTYYSSPALKGLVLVRGRDLVENDAIQFIAPTGSGFPSDTPPWPLKNELVLDAGHPPSRSATTGVGIWHVRQLIKQGWSGCWGFQIDGSNFSETITGFIRPY